MSEKCPKCGLLKGTNPVDYSQPNQVFCWIEGGVQCHDTQIANLTAETIRLADCLNRENVATMNLYTENKNLTAERDRLKGLLNTAYDLFADDFYERNRALYVGIREALE